MSFLPHKLGAWFFRGLSQGRSPRIHSFVISCSNLKVCQPNAPVIVRRVWKRFREAFPVIYIKEHRFKYTVSICRILCPLTNIYIVLSCTFNCPLNHQCWSFLRVIGGEMWVWKSLRWSRRDIWWWMLARRLQWKLFLLTSRHPS